MYVFLPDADSSPEKLLAILNGNNWQRTTIPGFSEREGTLMLPRFKLEYDIDLKQPLRALGIKHAFERAEFSGMSDESLCISEVKQKTFVEVNEEGTEAAAATGTMMAASSIVNLPKPFEMIVDRPFLFVIHYRDQSAGAFLLFMGVVFDPGM
jgi:serpin B